MANARKPVGTKQILNNLNVEKTDAKKEHNLITFSLTDFIEKPSQEMESSECIIGVNNIIQILEKNPDEVLQALVSHPFIHATFLLDDLCDKMRIASKLEKLGILLDYDLNKLIRAVIFNTYDLSRLIESMPSYKNKIFQSISLQQDIFNKIFPPGSEYGDHEDLLNKIRAFKIEDSQNIVETQQESQSKCKP